MKIPSTTWSFFYFPLQLRSVDTAILQHFIESDLEFLMEVTNKTKGDLNASIAFPVHLVITANSSSRAGHW